MATEDDYSRRRWLQALAVVAAQGAVACSAPAESESKYSVAVLRDVSIAHGYGFSDERLETIRPVVDRNLAQLEALRKFPLDESVEPAFMFLAKR